MERQRAVAGIGEDLEVAWASAKLTADMRHMISNRTPLVRLADDFIWFALRALRDTTVIHLWKVLDTNRKARSLPWFIRKYSSAEPSIQAADLLRVSTKSSDVRRLMRLRHELMAHRGSEATAKGARNVIEAHNLADGELRTLLQETTRILRRHHGSHLLRQLGHRGVVAVDQLIDLDVYLFDAYRYDPRYGIDRHDPVRDRDIE
jgi:hypothetical protein